MDDRGRIEHDSVALRQLIRRWWGKFLASFAIAALAAVPVLYSTIAIGNAVDAVRRDSGDELSKWVWILLGLAFGAAVLWLIRLRIVSKVAFDIEYELRREYFEKLLRTPVYELSKEETGQLVARGTADLRAVRTFLTGGVPSVAQLFAGFAFVLVQSGRSHPALGAIALLPVAGVTIASWFRLRSDTGAMHRARVEFGTATGLIDETIEGMALVRGYGRVETAAETVETHLRRGRSAMDEVFARNARFQAIVTALPYVGLLVVLAVGARLAIESGTVSGGNYVSIYLLLLMLVGPTASLATTVMLGQQAGAAVGRIDEVMRWPDIDGTPVDVAVGGVIELDDVAAGYQDPVFRDLSLRIQPGEKVAIAGPVGSGKSLFFRMLKGVMVPTAGSVRTAADTTLMTNSDALFAGTLREVLAYGRPDATDEEIHDALRLACADSFTDRLPDGLDTKVGGRRGRSFSGGEQQRLLLARAILTQPEVLALDGATVGLDPMTQSMVLANIVDRFDATVVIDGSQSANLDHVDRIVTIGTEGVVHDERVSSGERAPLAAASVAESPMHSEVPTIDGADPAPETPLNPAATSSGADPSVDPKRMVEEAERQAKARRRRMRAKRRAVLVGLLRPDRRWIGLAVLVVIIATAASLGPAFFGYRIVDDVLGARSLERLDVLTVLLAVSILLASIGIWVENVLVPWLGNRFLRRLRMQAFRKLLSVPMSYFSHQDAGRLLSQLTNNIELLSSMVLSAATTAVSAVALLLGMGIVFVVIDVNLAVIALCAIPLVGVGAWVMARARGWALARNLAGIGDLTAFMRETIDGAATMHAYGRVDWHRERFDWLNDQERRALWRSSWTFGLFSMYADLVAALAIVLVVHIGGHDALGGALAVGTLVVFTTYLNTGIVPVSTLATLQASYGQSMVAFDQLAAIVAMADDVDGDVTPSRTIGGRVPPEDSGQRLPAAIRFTDVWFAYDAHGWVLRHFKFHVAEGEHVLIVGESGAGKSSLLSLIMRFERPIRGTIAIGGTDLATVTEEWLREQIAFVPQAPYLFAGTIADNIALARPEVTREEIENVLLGIGLTDDVIESMGGLDRAVSSGAPELSAGQRQLVACARAMLADRPILLLDEATSVLEPEMAATLEAAFRRLGEGRTTVTVAHRVAERPEVDRIVVVADHHIVESGSHDDLLAAGGRYARWWRAMES